MDIFDYDAYYHRYNADDIFYDDITPDGRQWNRIDYNKNLLMVREG